MTGETEALIMIVSLCFLEKQRITLFLRKQSIILFLKKHRILCINITLPRLKS